VYFFFQAEDGIRDFHVTGVQTCALPISRPWLLSIARGGPPLGPRGLLWLEQLLTALDDTPLDGEEKILIATTLSGYALNEASLRSEERRVGKECRSRKWPRQQIEKRPVM